MNDDQITALAREYAEDDNPISQYRNHSEREWDILTDAGSAERVIRFLIRRYCLVEKKNAEEMYRDAKERYINPDDEVEKAIYGSRMSLLEYLCDGIEKEVEG